MAEGDTVLRAARRIEAALGGQRVAVEAPHPRGRAAGVGRLDGLRLEGVDSHGKHLLLDFGELVLHSHLGMNGSWRTYREGARWDRPRRSAWAVLRGGGRTVVQWGGPTLRVLRPEQARRDRLLARLGPDILDPALETEAAVRSLRRGAPDRALGEALLDQTLLSGIGNIFKSEGCFAARVDPWRPLGSLSDAELGQTVAATRELMAAAVEGRRVRAVYRRPGEPCPACATPLRSRGQGDANRTTYWCPRCQS